MFAFLRLIAALACLGAPLLLAQDPRGTLLGQITDPSGAVVPDVAITATNSATGVSAVARTNDSGRYTLPYLPAGFYRVVAELTGFKKYQRDRVEVRVGEITDLIIAMEVGQVTESVEITATTPLLDTTSPSLGQVIDQRRILELPTLAGNAFELALPAPRRRDS